MGKKYILALTAALLLTGCTNKNNKSSSIDSVEKISYTNEQIKTLYSAQQEKSNAKLNEIVKSNFYGVSVDHSRNSDIKIINESKILLNADISQHEKMIANVNNKSILASQDTTKSVIDYDTKIYLNEKINTEVSFSNDESNKETLDTKKISLDMTALYSREQAKAYLIGNASYTDGDDSNIAYYMPFNEYDPIISNIYSSLITSIDDEQMMSQNMNFIKGLIRSYVMSTGNEKLIFISSFIENCLPELLNTISEAIKENKSIEDIICIVTGELFKYGAIKIEDADIIDLYRSEIAILISAVSSIDFNSLMDMSYDSNKYILEINYDNVFKSMKSYIQNVYTQASILPALQSYKAILDVYYPMIIDALNEMPTIKMGYEITYVDDLPFAIKQTSSYDGGIPFKSLYLQGTINDQDTIDALTSTYHYASSEEYLVNFSNTKLSIPAVDVSKCILYEQVK